MSDQEGSTPLPISPEIRELMTTYRELEFAATASLDTDDPVTSKTNLEYLLEIAGRHFKTLGSLEGVTKPAELAQYVLEYAAQDPRLIFEVEPHQIDPNDQLSQLVRGRQRRYPSALELLTKMATDSDAPAKAS